MSLARKLLLAASTNAWLRDHATHAAFVRRSVSAFMPGEHLEDALAAARAQQQLGIGTIFTHLGENVSHVADTTAVAEHYVDVMNAVQAGGLNAQVAVKPTHLGLDIDADLARQHLRALVDHAEAVGNFVWLDMESSPYVDRTLDLFRHLRQRSSRVGVALQAYLYRTTQDIEQLIPLGAAIRLVKGAYLEPPTLAFARKRDVDENFFRLACRLLGAEAVSAGGLLHIATHDGRLVDRLREFAGANGVPRSAYEIAMLYGIQRPLQQRLIGSGVPLRVLIAYGPHWFPWYMRRLAERPANVGFVLKNLIGR
ncbi:MAG TPA: proline dehydrogenase family protein [Vicinamibacterales bacterium]|nr:proline dehydrogenase family protein [Vicinamibacterales bacterium]